MGNLLMQIESAMAGLLQNLGLTNEMMGSGFWL